MESISSVLNGGYVGKEIEIRGWVHRHRTSGSIVFLVLRDSTGVVQCAGKKGVVDAESWNALENAYIESSMIIRGTVKKDSRAPGGFEISVSSARFVSKGKPFPISKDKSEEFLMDMRHLWLRSRKLTNIMKSRHYIVKYLREFFENKGFFELPPPIITGSACEGGSTLFEFDYFGRKAYLSQSGQLYAESLIFSLENVYVFAPSFRAEKSRTRRHLAEYWHLEPEMAFYDWKMNMDLQEEMVCYVVDRFVGNHRDLLESLGRDPNDLKKVKKPFPRLHYLDAVEKVNELGMKMEVGEDFGADEEAVLTNEYDTPVFVHHFPKKIKAFYMKLDPDDPDYVLANDLLAPKGHGEIIGGSERIWSEEELLKRMEEENMPRKDYEWYIDLRRYGSVPHSGFGLGIERFVKWILNLDHIRDAIPYPRTINRCYP